MTTQTEYHLTAAEGFPAFERAVLDSRDEILMGFRVFDPSTKLRSEEATVVGEDWFDLLCDALGRGVRIRMILTDFDPVVRPSEHRMTWMSARKLIAIGEASGCPGNLSLTVSLHPARISPLASLVLWPGAWKKLREETRRLNHLPKALAERQLELMPGVHRYVTGNHPGLRPSLRVPPKLVPTTHHQKVAVFDRTKVYMGGLDLDERRYDTLGHERPADQTWHDCQFTSTDPALVTETVRHLETLSSTAVGEASAPSDATLLKTISAPRTGGLFYLSPRVECSSLEDAHIAAIDAAETLIYLETQYFRSHAIADALARAARRKSSLGLVIVLPGAPEDAAFEGKSSSDVRYGEYLQTRNFDMVLRAFGNRFCAVSPAQKRSTGATGRAQLYGAPLIYVHAKISIFDDACAIVSSANLNGRSMRWDTEVGFANRDRNDVTALRTRCFKHWLGRDADPAAFRPETLPLTWRKIARSNARRPPESRDGLLLPYPIHEARDLARNLPGIPEEMT